MNARATEEQVTAALEDLHWMGVLPLGLRLVHGAILFLLGTQVLYAGWQVFVVLQPAGTFGPMFAHAAALDPDLMMARRLYAVEAWIAFGALAIYVGLTEILPRRFRG